MLQPKRTLRAHFLDMALLRCSGLGRRQQHADEHGDAGRNDSRADSAQSRRRGRNGHNTDRLRSRWPDGTQRTSPVFGPSDRGRVRAGAIASRRRRRPTESKTSRCVVGGALTEDVVGRFRRRLYARTNRRCSRRNYSGSTRKQYNIKRRRCSVLSSIGHKYDPQR